MEQPRYGRVIHKLTQDEGRSEKVRYSSKAPDSYMNYLKQYAICTCDPWLFGHAEQIRDSTYITVYENKIEFNKPTVRYGEHIDNVTVIYFDRDIMSMNAEKAGYCTPKGTHGSCCPTCFDKWGEGLVLVGEAEPCCSMKNCLFLCNSFESNCNWCRRLPIRKRSVMTAGLLDGAGVGEKPYYMLYPVADADALANAINQARQEARAKWVEMEDEYGEEKGKYAQIAPGLEDMER